MTVIIFKKHRTSVAGRLVLRRAEDLLIILHLDSVFPMNKGDTRLRLFYQVEYH